MRNRSESQPRNNRSSGGGTLDFSSSTVYADPAFKHTCETAVSRIK